MPTGSAPPHYRALIAARLDRLPYGPFHRRVLVCAVVVFLFEVGDQTAAGMVAPSLPERLHTNLDGVAFVISSMYLGLLVGSIIAGRGDRHGRRQMLTWGIVLMSVFSGLSALSVNVPMLVGIRFIAGIGLGLTYISMIVYLTEVFPPRRRAFGLGLGIGCGAVGSIGLTHLARAVIPMGEHGWRVLFALGILGLIGLPTIRAIPESPRWLAAEGREEEAEAVLGAIERDLERRSGAPLPVPVPAPLEASETERDGRPGELWRGRLLFGMVMVMIVWVCHSLGMQIMNSWTPTLLGMRGFTPDEALSMSSTMLYGTVFGSAVTVVFGHRFPRRAGIVGFLSVAAVAMAVFGLATNQVAIVLAGVVVQFTVGTGLPMIAAYAAEQFPTDLRARGSGIGYSVGRLTNVIAPFTIAGVLGALGTNAIGWLGFLAWGLISVAVLALGGRSATAVHKPVAAAGPEAPAPVG